MEIVIRKFTLLQCMGQGKPSIFKKHQDYIKIPPEVWLLWTRSRRPSMPRSRDPSVTNFNRSFCKDQLYGERIHLMKIYDDNVVQELPEVGLGGREAQRQGGRGFSARTRRRSCTDASPASGWLWRLQWWSWQWMIIMKIMKITLLWSSPPPTLALRSSYSRKTPTNSRCNYLAYKYQN